MRRNTTIQPSRLDVEEAEGDGVAAGTIVAGRYRLERVVARGGMGTVWIATNTVLESSVALKVLHRSTMSSPEAGARLLTEARAAAAIRHPNILQVYNYGHFDTGEPFLVMELLDGEDLADRIRALGRIEPRYAVEIIRKVASALEAAHSRGVVHRDLKPENIFLSVDESCQETPKVVDFGIAWLASRQHAPRLTQAGRVVGSPAYLSPEQARGELVDCRSDIWSLCVTLYECLTGAPPFVDPSQPTLLIKILYDSPVPITDLGIGDDRLWKIIEKGLRKEREARWQSIGELAAALESWVVLRGSPGAKVEERDPAPPTRPERKDDSIPPAPGITLAPPAPRRVFGRRLGAAAVVLMSVAPVVFLALSGSASSGAASVASQLGSATEPVAFEARQMGKLSSRVLETSPVGSESQAPAAETRSPLVMRIARPDGARRRTSDAVHQYKPPWIPPEPNF